MSKNFVRLNIELNGYVSETALHGEFRFKYKPIPPKAAEVAIVAAEGMDAGSAYDAMIDRVVQQVNSWEEQDVAINKENVSLMVRALLIRMNRILLGTSPSDVDPKATTTPATSESTLGK